MSPSQALLLMLSITTVTSEDDYVKDSIVVCLSTRSSYYCSKYRFLKFIEEFDIEHSGIGMVNMVRMVGNVKNSVACERYRYKKDDVEVLKFWKFLHRKICTFLGSHALTFQVPEARRMAHHPTVESPLALGSHEGRKLSYNTPFILILV